ncbi:hypothetical protein [Actinomycetospora chibensis]|uniref:Uncharacterized protein n=1 Tax=Actinomycetospora chibensis TaxID=663606 RepID=A0ABV9RHV1_9PSEU|nr:hypothetical protein [Actinomycetospora chibensis]MDD7923766.1 hypothetical protein [Actinomycetospora chibensis]
MDFRRLPVLAGPVVAGLFLLGGCAAGPATSAAAPAETPSAAAAGTGGGPPPCTARLRPGATGGTPLTLSPEARSEIGRLREQPSGPATAQDPELAARLAEVSRRVERAARPCADR